jgi:hypothetical protein
VIPWAVGHGRARHDDGAEMASAKLEGGREGGGEADLVEFAAALDQLEEEVESVLGVAQLPAPQQCTSSVTRSPAGAHAERPSQHR